MEKPFIIVSAYSFAPRQGSESGTGWQTVQTLAEEYAVIVVCAAHYVINYVESDFLELKKQGIEIVFFDTSAFLWLLKLPGGIWTKLYYIRWQKAARTLYESLIRQKNPVALMHVTWGTGRVQTTLVGQGLPVIFGPVGGFESGSRKVDQGLGLKHRFEEELRRFHIWRSTKSRGLRKMYEQIDLVLACTKESAEKIQKLGARKVELTTNAGISRAKVEELQQLRQSKTANPHLQLFFASRFVGWKGEEIVIRTLAAMNDTTTRLIMLGKGRNRPRCISLARELNVEDRIDFIDFLPDWEDVWKLYTNSDIYLFPSLHDSGGTGALEAMAAGLPVICLDLGGPAEFVDDTCGAKITPDFTDIVVQKMAMQVQELRDNPELRIAKGNHAAELCREQFTWEARGVDLLQRVRRVWDTKKVI